MRHRDTILLCIVALVWGFNFIVIRWGLNQFPPLLFSALRFAVCALPAAFGMPRPDIPWRSLLLLGFTLGFLVFGLLYLGIYFGLGAGLASVLMQTQVFFTVVLARLALGEKMGSVAMFCTVLGLSGVMLIGLEAGATFTALGFALTTGGAFSWGVSNVLIKRLPSINTLHLMVWISVVPPLPLLASSVLFEGPTQTVEALRSMTAGGLMTVLYTSFVSTIFAYGVWGRMLQRYSAGQVSLFALLVPVVGLTAAWYFLGSTLSPVEVVGIAAIILALLISTGQRAVRGAAQARQSTAEPSH
ncbi:O-acetylserine/cysteine efflux transporter [Rhizobium sp. RU35A]|uniref:EamA family transporter n=1 Tax=Rhizobium sp. RU35A TaxID=1907414 RepID=UPI000953C791|nr:EamA family transporter [Rhizobium sp. RU35A]SIR43810.1 O-acetylserine/cysteine efflux transporter [Rhizobium sp. RU35A]